MALRFSVTSNLTDYSSHQYNTVTVTSKKCGAAGQWRETIPGNNHWCHVAMSVQSVLQIDVEVEETLLEAHTAFGRDNIQYIDIYI